jgi:hypothetical protein
VEAEVREEELYLGWGSGLRASATLVRMDKSCQEIPLEFSMVCDTGTL